LAANVATLMRIFSGFSKGAWTGVVMGLAVGSAWAAEAKSAKPFVPEFEFPAPLPVVAAAAAKNGMALEGMAPAVESAGGLQPGDQVTALVSLLKGKELTQWVIEATCVELNAAEKQQPPLRTWTFHTNTGTEIFLSATRAVLAVRILGPFEHTSRERDAGRNAVEQRARVTVNADFLGLGLDRACAAVMAVNAAKEKDPTLASMAWSMRMRPFSPAEIEAGRKAALSLGLTPERERAVAGANPALLEFFHVIRRTPGLQDILQGVIDVPWWTVIKRAGDVPVVLTPQYRYAEELPAAAPLLTGTGGKGYTVPFLLFIGGKPALVGKLAVVNPQRPLLACAGILGLAACAPDGEGPRVMLQIVSARVGGVK
jgi:hypothetical protein